MVDHWAGADDKALKILGDKGKIPKWPADAVKSQAEFMKAEKEYEAALKAVRSAKNTLDTKLNTLEAADAPTYTKSEKDFDAALTAFRAASSEMNAKLKAFKQAGAANVFKLSAFQAAIDKDDLGLDPKNKEDKPKIEKAQKILYDFLEVFIDRSTLV